MPLSLATSPQTLALCDRLRAVPLGQTVTYADLSSTLGADVTGRGRPTLSSARRIVARDHAAYFEVVRRTGLRRLHPDEAPDIGAAARVKTRRASARALRDMRALAQAGNGLDPEAQRRLSAELSAHGLLAAISADNVLPAVQGAQPVAQPVAPAAAAQAFVDFITGASK